MNLDKQKAEQLVEKIKMLQLPSPRSVSEA